MPTLLLRDAPDANLDTVQTSVINKFVKIDPDESRCIAFHKVGTGKTRLAYGWLSYLRQLRRAERVLVVIKPKAEYDWRIEAGLIGLSLYRIKFVSYANLKTVNLTIKYDTVIIDELFLFANPNSYRARRLAYICGKANNVLGLSGTIFPKNDNTCVWGYCTVIGFAWRIARGITDFRTRYQNSFTPKFNEQIKLFKPKEGWQQQLFPLLGDRVSFYFPKGYVRSIDREIRVALTKEQQRLINKLVKLYVLETPDGETFYKSATDVYHTVRSITNGWFYSSSGRLCTVACEKREVLLEKLSELHGSDERCVVWCAYRRDVEIIRLLLQVKSLPLVGGQPFNIEAWTSGRSNIVVATMASSESVNFLSSVNWGLFFSLSTKRLHWQQARGRMGRRGADASRTNQFVRYTVAGSLDDKVYRAIQETEASEETLIKEFARENNIKLPL
jgi:superfamily II DNA or RNA helicase